MFVQLHFHALPLLSPHPASFRSLTRGLKSFPSLVHLCRPIHLSISFPFPASSLSVPLSFLITLIPSLPLPILVLSSSFCYMPVFLAVPVLPAVYIYKYEFPLHGFFGGQSISREAGNWKVCRNAVYLRLFELWPFGVRIVFALVRLSKPNSKAERCRGQSMFVWFGLVLTKAQAARKPKRDKGQLIKASLVCTVLERTRRVLLLNPAVDQWGIFVCWRDWSLGAAVLRIYFVKYYSKLQDCPFAAVFVWCPWLQHSASADGIRCTPVAEVPSKEAHKQFNDRPGADWYTDWLAGWLADCPSHWMTNMELIDQLSSWLTALTCYCFDD